MNLKLKEMRNNFNFTFAFISFFSLFVQLANAQTLYNTVSTSQLNMPSVLGTESEGTYLIKDGELDEIYSLKLKTVLTDSLIGNKKITFEQTRVMVLPIMGMVHFIGTLDVDGVRSTTSFQLGFSVNSDQSITFKGTKLFKSNVFAEKLPKEEVKLNIDFVLKNSNLNLTSITTKK